MTTYLDILHRHAIELSEGPARRSLLVYDNTPVGHGSSYIDLNVAAANEQMLRSGARKEMLGSLALVLYSAKYGSSILGDDLPMAAFHNDQLLQNSTTANGITP